MVKATELIRNQSRSIAIVLSRPIG